MNNPHAYKQIKYLWQIYESRVPEDKRDEMLPWSSVSKEQENEFYGMKIFVNMFPWLFPGGIDDINECKGRGKTLEFKVWANCFGINIGETICLVFGPLWFICFFFFNHYFLLSTRISDEPTFCTPASFPHG